MNKLTLIFFVHAGKLNQVQHQANESQLGVELYIELFCY